MNKTQHSAPPTARLTSDMHHWRATGDQTAQPYELQTQNMKFEISYASNRYPQVMIQSRDD